MADKMLIDASHEEETRVVVVRGNRIEEFDFESQHKKQLRGNIYLAKVTRVEPSLQAAFVDYGGNRHGFLAFSEIHPDYYQIPLADRQALLAAEAEAEAERARHEADDDEAPEAEETAQKVESESEEKPRGKRGRGRRSGRGAKKAVEAAAEDDDADEGASAEVEGEEAQSEVEAVDTAAQDLEGTREGAAADQGENGANDVEAEADTGSDEDDDGEGGPRSMAAIVETDSISEPVEADGGDDETEVDPGEVDQEAAEFVEGKAEESARPRRSRRRSGRGRPEQGGAGADTDEDDDNEPEARRRDDHDEENGSRVESVGAEDALEEVPDRSVRKPRKQYRIQEVIKRRQILLVQVVKEERGNKGAALTTYLSLAGRYSVLMPNTARGGGISRKITNIQDRKRLKEIAKGLDVPQGMGVILRTAGANRTKAEIKRDFEYLMRLWENVRSLTLASTAPCLVYEEGSLIKRSIRDLYNKDIGQIIVAGEEGYREAKDFMKMLMPSHAKVVQPYRDVHPIFSRSGIEAQLDRMLQPQVTLKSGGYIIINQTEALVAIDVNSGRSTKEHSIEDTALQTNLEAADEVARQLRLRDLAGLIVVDFIDMEEKRNNRSVEKRLKDALKNDRARIQVGRISHFGLLEMSRQRIRASVLESTTQICDHCGGTGHVRSQSSVALHVIRSIEEYLLKSTTHDIIIRTMPTTALYVLNQKRETIIEMERRFGVAITIEADTSIGSSHLEIDRGAAVEAPVRIEDILPAAAPVEEEDEDVPVEIDDEDETEAEAEEHDQQPHGESDGQQRRKRRRRRRGGRDREHDGAKTEGTEEARSETVASHDGDGEDGERPKKRRRRGKRGGRRNRGGEEAAAHADAEAPLAGDGEATEQPEPAVEEVSAIEAPEAAEEAPAAAEAAPAPAETAEEEAPAEKPKRRRSRSKKAEAESRTETTADEQPVEGPAEMAEAASEAEAAPAEEEAPAKAAEEPAAAGPVVISNGNVTEASKEAETAEKPKKVGWWQRRSFF